MSDRDIKRILDSQGHGETGSTVAGDQQTYELDSAAESFGDGTATAVQLDSLGEPGHGAILTTVRCESQPKVAALQLAPSTESVKRRSMRTDAEYFRQRMNALGLSQKQMALLIEKVTGKKLTSRRPEAAVNRQLTQRKLNPKMALVYDQALQLAEREVRPIDEPSPDARRFHDKMKEAMRLLLLCDDEQIGRVVGYLEALLQSPPQRR